MHNRKSPSAAADTPCAHCGAVLNLDSRAFAPIEYEDGLVCPACDEAAMADAVEMDGARSGLAAFHRAYAATAAGALA
jgi:hypothetical protein